MESRKARLARQSNGQSTAFAAMIGDDPALRHAIDMAGRAAKTDCSVLIVGETGTGKELVAQAIHRQSPRHNRPWVPVNCGAISRDLIASELFGHKQGAFTGATSDRSGVFVQAHRGTLFLDELGELPLDQQPNLLRVLETRRVRPIGDTREHVVDVRVVAATNRLEHLGTDASVLRLDLFHRVATVIIELPPLRERPDDIPGLTQAFMDEFTSALGRHTISPAVMRQLSRYSWPGNVRELRQAVQRAMTLCDRELTVEHLLPRRHHSIQSVTFAGTTRARDQPSAPTRRNQSGKHLDDSTAQHLRPIDLIIRDALIDALDANPSIRAAARSLGMAKSTFSDWMRRLGIANE